MKRILIPAFAVLLASPAFADAEAFGEKMLEQNGSNASEATRSMAGAKLTGDTLDERLPVGDVDLVTRNATSLTPGHLQLARNMGVDPQDYSLDELASMYIGKYD